MRFVPNFDKAWQWFSVQAMAFAAAFPIAWEMLPPELKTLIPDSWMKWVVAGILIGGIFGRLLDQGTTKEEDK